MKRLLTLLLVLAMLIGTFALVGCGGEPAETGSGSSSETKGTETESKQTNPSDTADTEPTGTGTETFGTETSETETAESTSSGTGVIPEDPTLDGLSKHPDYMDVNFGGREFSFIVNYGWSGGWDIYEICAELTGDDTILDEAIDKRNKTVESLYNCKITQKQSDTDGGKGAHGFIGDDIALGQCNFQFCMPLWQNLMVQNFYNIATLDVNLNNSWWDQDYINAMGTTIDGTDYLYCISGQFNLLTYDSAIAMLVNRTLYDQLFATGKIKEDIFQAAREGRWTMEMLYETMLEASTDANGDMQLTFEDGDVFGMVDDRNYNTIKALLAASGIDCIVKNEAGTAVPVNPADEALVNRMQETVTMAAKIFTAPTFGLIGETNCVKTIASGQALFMPQYMLRLHCTDELVVYGVDFSDTKLSILPFPKLDETQDRYYSFVCNRAVGLKVSRAIDNPTEIANFMEVFGFHSQKILYPQYVNYLRTQCLDGKDGDMLDLVLESRHIDVGTFLAKGLAGTVVSVVSAGKDNITTYLNRTYNTYCNELQEYADNVKKNAQ